MRIAIPDDYQDAVRTLDCFQKLNGQHVAITREHLCNGFECKHWRVNPLKLLLA